MNDTQKAWMLTSSAVEELGYDVFTEDQLKDRYEEELDSEGEVKVAGVGFLPSNILHECDPIAYGVGFADFTGTMYDEISGGDYYVLHDDLDDIMSDLDDAIEEEDYDDKSLLDIAKSLISKNENIEDVNLENALMDIIGDDGDLSQMKVKWAIMKAREEESKCKAASKKSDK